MYTSVKAVLIVAGLFGLTGLGNIVRANQAQTPVAVMPGQITQVAEASDGDGEANPATEAHEKTQKPQSKTLASSTGATPIAEASDGDGEKNDDNAKNQQEMIKLKPLAKITSQQAQQAAETAQGGKANSVKLEAENGSLVYAVIIGNNEVMVDAGNGKVLHTNSQNNEKAEGNYPRGSIQVSQTGDGDGETK